MVTAVQGSGFKVIETHAVFCGFGLQGCNSLGVRSSGFEVRELGLGSSRSYGPRVSGLGERSDLQLKKS